MKKSVVIVGAGPAGLTAAYELVKQGFQPTVLEKMPKVGGISRTENYNGYHFDIGGHRFYTKVSEVEQLWHEVLQHDFIKVERLSRIYYRHKFFNYPINIVNVIRNLGLWESFKIFLSYLSAQAFPNPTEETLEDWVINRFGKRLYLTFFKTYTEKVWGIPCNQIRAEWAEQRIKGLSFISTLKKAILGSGDVKSLIEQFEYPKLGPGMMWEAFQRAVEDRQGKVHLKSDVLKISTQNNRVVAVTAQTPQGVVELPAEHFISSMPLAELISKLEPKVPAEIAAAAQGLKYRDFLIVAIVIERDNLFPDNWIYIHNKDVKVGRIQNFKNWSALMVPEKGKSCLGMEYFCNEDDPLWRMSNPDLISLAKEEIGRIGLAQSSEVSDGTVIRQLKAYPVYDETYRQHLETLQKYLQTIPNLQTIGRNGMHRYNNQDHSMLTGLLAARNILGEQHDLWNVNTERSYYEEFSVKESLNEAVKTENQGQEVAS